MNQPKTDDKKWQYNHLVYYPFEDQDIDVGIVECKDIDYTVDYVDLIISQLLIGDL